MGACCCSLADTRACDTCSNGPMRGGIPNVAYPVTLFPYPDSRSIESIIEDAVRRVLAEKEATDEPHE